MNLKVTKYELIISNQSEMADDYIPEGLEEPPPNLLGLIGKLIFRLM